ncbi:MAG: rhamnulokinase family protein [Actinomycetota bacterium]
MRDAPTAVAAVDLGATSVRVVRVELADDRVTHTVVHRLAHSPARDRQGVLRWDWDAIVRAVHTGLAHAAEAGPLASIGVDTWGVDYGLLDGTGALLADPVSYRDDRTRDFRTVIDRIGARRLFEIAGLQEVAINTIFQLAAHDPHELGAAATILMLPELVVHHLTGTVTGERTSAGTTGLLDAATAQWSAPLAEAIGLAPSLLPHLAEPGTLCGTYGGVPVRLVGGHDTASAVVAGATDGAPFVATGTWLLVGCERSLPNRSAAAHDAGFSNEQGTFGDIRFLRNVAGWWLIEECRREWGEADTVALVEAAADAPPPPQTFDATDERFLAPASMSTEIRNAAHLAPNAPHPHVVRAALESMAATVARVLDALSPHDELRVFGGAARSGVFVELLSRHTGTRITTGPAEAAALGNAVTQGVALGIYESQASARAALDEGART